MNKLAYCDSSLTINNMMNLSSIENVLHFAQFEKNKLDMQMGLISIKNETLDFSRSNYSDVYSFFDEIKDDYDSDLKNPYWAFSHQILKFILTKFITEHFDHNQKIKLFDAGAGTGNWSKFIQTLGSNIKGTMFDMNSGMLNVAYSKMLKLGNNYTKIIEGNLEVFTDYPIEKSNLILCMHNVIGLGRNTDLILKNLFLYLEKNGLAFIMAPNKYHAFNFLNQQGNYYEAQRVINDKTVKFKPDMPEMFCYTPNEFRDILLTVGFKEVTVLGFPISIYPSSKDTQLLRRETLTQQLNNTTSRMALLNLEKQLCLYPELAYRGGSSLIAICKKN